MSPDPTKTGSLMPPQKTRECHTLKYQILQGPGHDYLSHRGLFIGNLLFQWIGNKQLLEISNEICLNLQYFVKTKTSDITLSQTQPTLTTRVSRQERNHPLWGQNNKHFGLTPKCKPVGPTLELYRLIHNNHNLKLPKQNHIITNHHNNLI